MGELREPPARRVIANVLWGFLHHGLGRACLFVFFLALPTLMTIEDVGRFTIAYTVLLLLVQPVAEASLGLIVAKYTARGDLAMVRVAFAGAGRVLPVALGVLWVASLLAPVSPVLTAVLVAYLGLILYQALVFAYLRGRQRMRMEGVVGSLEKVASLAALLGLWRAGITGPLLPALALLAMACTGWILTLLLFRGEIRELRGAMRASAGGAAPRWLELVREGLALGAVGLVGFLYFRLDVLMLGAMVGTAEVGYYFTASRCVEATYIVPTVLMLVLMPRLARERDVRPLLVRTAWVMGGLGIVALAATVTAIGWVVPLVYGPGFGRIAVLVRALAPAIVAVYLGFLFTQALVVLDLQRRYLAIAVAGLVVNVACNVVLIPLLEGVGAAIATVVTEGLVTIAAGWSALRACASGSTLADRSSGRGRGGPAHHGAGAETAGLDP
ncbi:MAG: polysaccharide biosynthesis C-terminal domain-containing protein [Acidobacteriia bacterium]|nr:polysaccharide biosynthesis C-terminal domain-containing protein [Terriglobia bacterium]